MALNLELGFYIPGFHSPVELAIYVGLKGVLGLGTIGLKLEYNLNQNQLAIELYYQFEAFSLYFYIQIVFTYYLLLFKIIILINFFNYFFKYFFNLVNKRIN